MGDIMKSHAFAAYFRFIYGLKMNECSLWKPKQTKNEKNTSFAAYDDKISLEKHFFRSLRIYEPYIFIWMFIAA